MKKSDQIIAIAIIFLLAVGIAILSVKYEQQQKIIAEQEIKISEQQARISDLEALLYHVRQVNDLIPILEQILTPLQLDELRLQSEQTRQWKANKAKNINYPAQM